MYSKYINAHTTKSYAAMFFFSFCLCFSLLCWCVPQTNKKSTFCDHVPSFCLSCQPLLCCSFVRWNCVSIRNDGPPSRKLDAPSNGHKSHTASLSLSFHSRSLSGHGLEPQCTLDPLDTFLWTNWSSGIKRTRRYTIRPPIPPNHRRQLSPPTTINTSFFV